MGEEGRRALGVLVCNLPPDLETSQYRVLTAQALSFSSFPRRRESSLCFLLLARTWMPAFAGMT
jgi:hypothetical protein